jgi:hypothetical protein
MIVSKNINPENDIYYLGALVLGELSDFKSKKVDFFELYGRVKEKYSLSASLFGLVLDWLFLLGTVKSEDKYVVKCF